jgi:hypothetical protein
LYSCEEGDAKRVVESELHRPDSDIMWYPLLPEVAAGFDLELLAGDLGGPGNVDGAGVTTRFSYQLPSDSS